MVQAHAIEKALSLVAKSLTEPIPSDIDDCIDGIRFIVKFTGKDENVLAITAEILDSDWMPDAKAGEILKEKVNEAVHYRNIEFREAIEQAFQIRRDMYGYKKSSLTC